MGKCFGCGGDYLEIDGPTHRYMSSTPGCWAVYGEILARGYSDPSYFEVHRLAVDAYAVQHPGAKDRQSIQSVGFHLARLCLFLEHGLTGDKANDAMLKIVEKKHLIFWLEPPASMGAITAADVYRSKALAEHKASVRKWAQTSWNAWAQHHDIVRSWLGLGELSGD